MYKVEPVITTGFYRKTCSSSLEQPVECERLPQAKMRPSTISLASFAMLGGFDIAQAVCTGSNLAIGTPVDLGTGNTQCKAAPICANSTLPDRAPQQDRTRVLSPILTTDNFQIMSMIPPARPSKTSRSAPASAHVSRSTSSVPLERRPLKATTIQQPESRITAKQTRLLSPAEAT